MLKPMGCPTESPAALHPTSLCGRAKALAIRVHVARVEKDPTIACWSRTCSLHGSQELVMMMLLGRCKGLGFGVVLVLENKPELRGRPAADEMAYVILAIMNECGLRRVIKGL